MQRIPGGTIQMRDDRTKAQWKVTLESFSLAKTPVTQYLYNRVTNQNPSAFQGDSLPVETVSWIDAVQFCNLLSAKCKLQACYSINGQDDIVFNPNNDGYRLPTEAEWQFACMGGSDEIRYGKLEDIAWFKENSDSKTHPVGQKQANAFGLHDMLGNVWEWCSDIYDEEVYGSYRVFKGGGWCDVERSVMATTRRRSHPRSFKIDDLGFRIARSK